MYEWGGYYGDYMNFGILNGSNFIEPDNNFWSSIVWKAAFPRFDVPLLIKFDKQNKVFTYWNSLN